MIVSVAPSHTNRSQVFDLGRLVATLPPCQTRGDARGRCAVRLLEAVVERASKPGPQTQGCWWLVLQLPGSACVESMGKCQSSLFALFP